MHNGCVAHFSKIQKLIIGSLDTEIFKLCEGTSDSWYLFCLFLQCLSRMKKTLNFLDIKVSGQEMAMCLKEVLSTVHQFHETAGITSPSSLNFAVTDGETVVCTRYRNGEHS